MQRVGIIGVRGIPVPYSGFETLAEQLSIHLVKRGYEMKVYCRTGYVQNNKKYHYGIGLVHIRSPKNKYFETFFHSLFSTVHACFYRNVDVILYLGVGSAPFSILPRLFGIKTIVHIDGLDWKRKKWGLFGKIYLLLSEFLALFLPNCTITDTSYAQDYILKRYTKKIRYIPNGFLNRTGKDKKIQEKYNLKKNNYIVWVGRLVPDNNLEELLDVLSINKYNFPCVIIGGDHYDLEYQKKIFHYNKKISSLIFTDFIPQADLIELVSKSRAYIETKRSGGSHPSLIEAMGLGCLIIANDHPTTRSILGSGGKYYSLKNSFTSLTAIINSITQDRHKYETFKVKAKNRAEAMYSWDEISNRYEELFSAILL
ncbi:hypothetical protein COY16_06255 [Candidatus Roizmanbacteria bacterium CG_4_10_14_0_2_um_filter_39_13]|uniref:Glycosyl transferase family 1 n=1 Tax=Candidatus Roizmanbacteria bacterium CG_4_10_14_0_2_um_filter_39_13 TaxID=1974825 RepID=A0A2M7TV23_9BACT|nr:MAG: hypothetical protein COY16_06255 [Candidatus Roizmanbacteria bacterium CG_4_10_14_0_2_um_filter_39_13]